MYCGESRRTHERTLGEQPTRRYTRCMQGPPVNPTLSDDDVRKVATLSKLAVADAAIDAERTKLEAVLGYVERLRELDLDGVEPMTRASDEPARLRDDTPGEPLKGDALATLAPDLYEQQQVDADGEGADGAVHPRAEGAGGRRGVGAPPGR